MKILKKAGAIILSTTGLLIKASIPTISGISGSTLIKAVPSGTVGEIEDHISTLLSAINLCMMLLSLNDLVKALSSLDRNQLTSLKKQEWCLLGILSLLSLGGFGYCLNRFGIQKNNLAAGLSNAAGILLAGLATIYLSHRFDFKGIDPHARLEEGYDEIPSRLFTMPVDILTDLKASDSYRAQAANT